MDKDYYYDVEIEEGSVYNTGTTRYPELTDKPKIEGVTLEGDKSFHDLGLDSILRPLYDEIATLNEKVAELEAASINAENGVHGLRYNGDQLQIKSGDNWVTLPSVCG